MRKFVMGQDRDNLRQPGYAHQEKQTKDHSKSASITNH